MLTQLRDFFQAIGHPTKRVFVRAFSPKEMSMEDRLSVGHAYCKTTKEGDKIYPLSPMGYLDFTSNSCLFTATNGRDKGSVYTDGLLRLREINKQGYGIYFTVNPGGQDLVDILSAHSIFFEYDNIDKPRQLEVIQELSITLGVQPTITETRNSYHTYFRLSQAIYNLEAWQIYQERVIQKLGSDKAIRNFNRVMRIPFFDYWYWDGELKNYGPVQLIQVQDSHLNLSDLDLILPDHDLEYWGRTPKALPTPSASNNQSQAQTRQLSDDVTLAYFDILNFAHYLDHYNPNGRKGWITAQCPAQGEGHSNTRSHDSLHINARTGQIKCHAGCSGQSVYRAAHLLAIQRGYPTFTDYLKQQGIYQNRKVQASDYHPDESAPAPDNLDACPDFFGEGESILIDHKNDSPGHELSISNTAASTPVDWDYLEAIASGNPVQVIDTDETELPPGFIRSDQVIETPSTKQSDPDILKRLSSQYALGDSTSIAPLTDDRPNDQTGQSYTSIRQAARLLQPSALLSEVMSRYYWIENLEQWYDLTHRKPVGNPKSTINIANQGDLFANHNGNMILIQDKPTWVQPYDVLVAQISEQACSKLVYLPGQPRLVALEDNKLPALNIAEPLPAVTPASDQDVEIWRTHLRNLYTDEQAEFLEWWMAMTIYRPEIVMDYAPVLIAQNQRTGRETALRPLFWHLGKQAYELQAPAFKNKDTRFLSGIKLLKVNELPPIKKRYSALDINWTVLLKTWIDAGEGQVTISANYQRDELIQRKFNVVILSNEINCLEIGKGELRLMPIVSEWSPWFNLSDGQAYMTQLNTWLQEGGNEKVIGYLSTVKLDDERFSPYFMPLHLADHDLVTDWSDSGAADLKAVLARNLKLMDLSIDQAIAIPLPFINELMKGNNIEASNQERNALMKRLGFRYSRKKKKSKRWEPSYRYYVCDNDADLDGSDINSFLELWEA